MKGGEYNAWTFILKMKRIKLMSKIEDLIREVIESCG